MKNANEKIYPSGDARLRANRSERLWVLNRGWSKNTDFQICGVVESIERTICLLDGRCGEWVRYDNCYYPLHSKKEFIDLLLCIRSGKIEFFNNESAGSCDPVSCTTPASYICLNEKGPVA